MLSRFIIVVAVIQTVLLVYLIATSHSHNQPVREHLSQIPERNAEPSQARESLVIDEFVLRRIIRDEMDNSGLFRKGGAEVVNPAGAESLTDPFLLDEIRFEMEQMKGAGPIPDVEMKKLESRISTLDPAGRRELFSELVRSINSGEIAGRLN